MKQISLILLVLQLTMATTLMAYEPTNAPKQASIEKAGVVIKMTKADFLEKVMDYEKNPTEWVYKGIKPSLIDFYADWCGPCRTASPILDELAAEYADKIIIYKVDTDVEKELAAVFGVRSLPSFLYCPMEGKPSMASGIGRDREQTKEMFKNYIDTLLLGISE